MLPSIVTPSLKIKLYSRIPSPVSSFVVNKGFACPLKYEVMSASELSRITILIYPLFNSSWNTSTISGATVNRKVNVLRFPWSMNVVSSPSSS